MKILIVKMSAIGDVIHTLPALNALRRRFPHAEITWLVEAAAKDLVTGHPALDRVIVSGRKRWMKTLFTRSFKNTLKEAAAFLRDLRDTEYDMIIDFQGLLKSGLMVFLARGNRKIGFDRGMQHAEESHIFYNERISPVDMEIHALERGLRLLEAIGVPANFIEYRLAASKEEEDQLSSLLLEHRVSLKEPIICINPQGTWETKLWYPDRFARLADKLIQAYDARIIFTGGPEDRPVIQGIIRQMQHPAINLCGSTSLKTLGLLYQRARLLVTTDTGPMHLGVAAGTRVCALFGPTAPWRTGPHGKGHGVVRTGISCSPCFKRHCPYNRECMDQVQVSDVFKTIQSLMGIPE